MNKDCKPNCIKFNPKLHLDLIKPKFVKLFKNYDITVRAKTKGIAIDFNQNYPRILLTYNNIKIYPQYIKGYLHINTFETIEKMEAMIDYKVEGNIDYNSTNKANNLYYNVRLDEVKKILTKEVVEYSINKLIRKDKKALSIINRK